MYVTFSEIAVPECGVEALRAAFRERLAAVDRFAGFVGLEVLQDRRRPGRLVMVTRWESCDDFRAYMRSPEHRHSHSRIPGGPGKPRPAGFSDYDLVAT